jgi:hypothetical protein
MDISAGISSYTNGHGMLNVIGLREETLSQKRWYLASWKTLEMEKQKRQKAGT